MYENVCHPPKRRRSSQTWDQVTVAYVAAHYGRHATLLWIMNWVPTTYRVRAAERLCPRPGMTVAEFGSGWGTNAPYLSQRAKAVLMFEVTPKSHHYAVKKYRGLKNVHFFNNDVFSVDEKADGYLFSFSYCTFPDSEKRIGLLQRLWDQLPAGGRIVILDANLKPGSWWRRTLPFWSRLMSKTLMSNPYIQPVSDLREVVGSGPIVVEALGLAHYLAWAEKS